MSTEAAGVPEDSKKYWVDVGANKKKDTIVLVKSGPKPVRLKVWPPLAGLLRGRLRLCRVRREV